MRWRYTWRVGVSSAADGAASTGVVAGMRAHVPSFAHACARPLSMPVPALCPCPLGLVCARPCSFMPLVVSVSDIKLVYTE